jgi:F-type H+-transporting ATPase subunit delta
LNGALALRYAAALADVALEQKNAEQVRDGLHAFAEALASSSDLRNVLLSPAISREAKQKAIERLSGAMGLAPAVRNFVYLLIDHGRTEMLGEIQSAFESELSARLGIAEAEVTSAQKLSEPEREQLTAALAQHTGKKIQARFREDEALVGGAVVQVGSTVYDGSVREQLIRLRAQLETE